MAFLEGLASLIASPLLGLSFGWGLKIGGIATALPFFITASLYLLGGISVFCTQTELVTVTDENAEEGP